MTVVYVTIGNSDDKLSQVEWAAFYAQVDEAICELAGEIHGAWMSHSTDPFQNACWCIEIERHAEVALKADLAVLAGSYKQESIAWAAALTTFIKAAEG